MVKFEPMKRLMYFLVLLFIAAIVVGVVKLKFDSHLFAQDNLYQWITICAGACGLLLSFILIRYRTLKEKLNRK